MGGSTELEALERILEPCGFPTEKLKDICRKLYKEDYIAILPSVLSGDTKFEDFQSDLRAMELPLGTVRLIVDRFRNVKKAGQSFEDFILKDSGSSSPASRGSISPSPVHVVEAVVGRVEAKEDPEAVTPYNPGGVAAAILSHSVDRRYRESCPDRFHCKAGIMCKLSHSEPEVDFFRLVSQADRRVQFKIKKCPSAACKFSMGKCMYAHNSMDMYCTNCDSWGHLNGHESCPNFRDIEEEGAAVVDYKEPCPNHFHCDAGLECVNEHTSAERHFFVIYPVAKVRIHLKTEQCSLGPSCPKGIKECKFAHEAKDMFCRSCCEWGHLDLNTKCPKRDPRLSKPPVVVAVDPRARTSVARPATAVPTEDSKECPYRYRCSAGLKCALAHSHKEKEFFRNFDTTYRAKEERCRYDLGKGCIRGSAACSYAHTKEDMFCRKCKSWGHLDTKCKSTDRPAEDTKVKLVPVPATIVTRKLQFGDFFDA